jgi:hypothetical protein
MAVKRRKLRRAMALGSAIALMFAAACLFLVLGNIIGYVSARPEGREADIAKLEVQGDIDLALAAVATVLAAWLLGVGEQPASSKPSDVARRTNTATASRHALARTLVSFLLRLGFAFLCEVVMVIVGLLVSVMISR